MHQNIYQNQFSNYKKGAIAKPESPKKHLIWAAHPHTHLSTKYPPGLCGHFDEEKKKQKPGVPPKMGEGEPSKFEGRGVVATSNLF